MKKFDFTRILFLATTLIIITLGVAFPNNNLVAAITGAIIILSLVIFDIQAPRIVKLSEENPKVKTLRFLNRLNIFVISICAIFVTISPLKNLFTSKNNQLVLVALGALLIMIFGNLAPKIPFNRYLGIRLPWTVRDEETWRMAHRILGYLSFPIAIIMLILSFYFGVNKIAPYCILAWVAIPSFYSLLFYFKKLS